MEMQKFAIVSMGTLLALTMLAFGAFAVTLDQGLDAFVSDTTAPYIVVGRNSVSIDTIAAADLAARLGSYVTQTVTCPSAAATATVSNGADLSTTNTKLYSGDAINKAKDTLTASDLPTLLASGTVTDKGGTEYDYDQYIAIGSRTIVSGDYDDDSDTDPATYIDIGTSVSSPLYTLKVVFQDELNVSDSDVPGSSITLFGKELSIASGSTNTKLILYGSAQTLYLSGGESQTVTIGGTTYTVTYKGSGSSSEAVVQVNDEMRTLTTSSPSAKVSGLNVHLDEVYYISSDDQTQNSIKLSVGSQKIILEHGKSVKLGDEEESVDNTNVTIKGTNAISEIDIAVAAQDADEDYIIEGSPYVDPIFGTIKVSLGPDTPSLTDTASWSSIEVKTSSSKSAVVTFTNDKGVTKTIAFGYDSAPSATGTTLQLADGSGRTIHVVENESASEKDYIVISQGDFSHLLQITDIDVDSACDGEVDLKDVFSGTTYTATISGCTGEKIIDGKTYTINIGGTNNDTLRMTWGSASQIDVFPLLSGAKGEKIAFTDNVQVLTNAANGTTHKFLLPGSDTTVTLTIVNMSGTSANMTITDPQSSTTWWNVSSSTPTKKVDVGQLDYNFSATVAGGKLNLTIAPQGVYGGYSGQAITTPAILILEEEGKAYLTDTDVQNAIIVATREITDGSIDVVAHTSISFTDAAYLSDWPETTTTDNFVSGDRYGVVVNSDESGDKVDVTIMYPDNQVVKNVAIGSDPTWTTGTATTGGTYETAVPIKMPVGKFDDEIDTATLDRDIILVGGPCANSLTATVLADDNITCDTWPYSSGQALLKIDTLNGHNVLIVAGTTGDDTRMGASWLQNIEDHATDLSGKTLAVVTQTSVVESV